MDTEFQRTLGPWSAGALVAGSMIGTGIFFLVGDVAARVPGYSGIIAAWIVGAAVASTGALSLAELASTYPRAGGIYIYVRRAFGSAAGFLYIWAKFLIMRPGSFAIFAVAFADFTIDFLQLGTSAAELMREPFAIGVIVLLTVINIIGVRAGAAVQNVLTAIKVLCVAAIIGIGLSYGAGLLEGYSVEVESASTPQGSFPVLFLAALIPVMWTFGGWDESPFVAEEVRSPERNLPLSILGGLWLVALLYVAVNAAYLAVLSPGEMAATTGRTATVAMQRALGPGARRALALVLMASTFGAANGLALTGARLAYAGGRREPFMQWLGKLHVATQTPVRSLALQCVLAVGAVLYFSDPMDLLLYTGLAYWVFAALSTGAVFVMRWKDPDRQRPFRVWGYPVTPAVFVLASLAMAGAVIYQRPLNAAIAAGICAAGGIVYATQRILYGAPEEDERPDEH
ncbi:MAG: amino acid permease [Planctomycetota bacterium]